MKKAALYRRKRTGLVRFLHVRGLAVRAHMSRKTKPEILVSTWKTAIEAIENE